ncbi:MAG: hypothetical protein QM636_10970, partial [Rhizobium sp.]
LRVGKAAPQAPLFARRYQSEKAGVEQLVKIIERELAAGIVMTGAQGKIIGKVPCLADQIVEILYHTSCMPFRHATARVLNASI